jgi:hypothetical protein
MNTLQQSLQNARNALELTRQGERITKVYNAALQTLKNRAAATDDPHEIERIGTRFAWIALRYRRFAERHMEQCDALQASIKQ